MFLFISNNDNEKITKNPKNIVVLKKLKDSHGCLAYDIQVWMIQENASLDTLIGHTHNNIGCELTVRRYRLQWATTILFYKD